MWLFRQLFVFSSKRKEYLKRKRKKGAILSEVLMGMFLISFVIVYIVSWVSQRESTWVHLNRIKERSGTLHTIVKKVEKKVLDIGVQKTLNQYQDWTNLNSNQRGGVYEVSTFKGKPMRQITFRLRQSVEYSSSVIQKISNSNQAILVGLEVSDDGGKTFDECTFLVASI